MTPCPEVSGFVFFVFMLGGIVIGLLLPALFKEASTWFEPPFRAREEQTNMEEVTLDLTLKQCDCCERMMPCVTDACHQCRGHADEDCDACLELKNETKEARGA